MGDAGCSAPAFGGGATGGGNNDGSLDDTGGGTAGCNAGPSASQCEVCANANCCTQFSTCTSTPPGRASSQASSECNNLLNCADGCTNSACVSDCEQTYPTGVPTYNELDSCLNLKCPICNESGVGDPCVPGANACVSGLTCNGLWCTRPCTVTGANCTGIGPGGGNYLGEPNECVPTTSGDFCAPGCTTTLDCTSFPNTNCRSATPVDGVATLVCENEGDGG